jgi:phenylpropionate dioxygenase-like ring-hydroxylating dioxygenase large terminal subunit
MDSASELEIEQALDYESGRTEYPAGFPALPEISGGRYTRQDFYDLEIECIWQKNWLAAGREDELVGKGAFVLFEKLGKAVIIVRGADGVIRAFHNTCRHRGAALSKLCKGNVTRFVCGYHNWTYDLAGRLIGVPEEFEFGGLDRSTRGLLPVRCESWGGWIFLNFDPTCRPLAETLGPLANYFAPFEMSALSVKGRLSYVLNCNWKAAFDAFIEAYHVRAIHPKTIAPLLDSKALTVRLFAGGHSSMTMRKKAKAAGGTLTDISGPDIPTVPAIFRRNSFVPNIFPNTLVPLDSGGVGFMTFWPTGVSSSRIELTMIGSSDDGMPNAKAYWADLLAGYDAVAQEDVQFLSGIQASLQSGAFTGIRLGYQERRIYWLHEEVDRRIGTNRIPAALAVKQVLGRFIDTHQTDAMNPCSHEGRESSGRGTSLAEERQCP